VLDFHNHMIPGVDDGSASLEESLVALENMWEQGITHVITTPHFAASTVKQRAEFESQMAHIDASWAVLMAAVRDHLPRMKLDRGVELALDDPNPVVTDPRLRLAGTRFALVEFPDLTLPLNSVQPLLRLKVNGVTSIVAHPERYENLAPPFEILRAWKQAGAFLQLNAGSLVGAYGARVQRNAWHCLESGLVDYISSDYHARGTCLMAGARERLVASGGISQLRALTEYNGDRLVDGLDPTPVAPLERPKSRWGRLRKALGWN
jgi:protein-tyrosine phosphatase